MGKKPLSDDAMLESEDEFTELYQAYQPGIFRFLYWRTRDADLSEDLTSSVFTKAWQARGRFQGGSVKAWLYRIARNTLTDHWRSRHDVAVEDMDDIAEPTADVAERLDIELELERLERIVSKLPKQMRQIVQLRFIEGMSAREAGERLGLSEGNVRIIQYRALQRIRNELS